MPQAQRQHRFAVILAFGLVYFFWGSTYLGIDIAVEHIPPALMCGIRFLIAGGFMLAYCGLRGRKIAYQPRQLARMAVGGRAAAGGRQPHAGLCGEVCRLRAGGSHHRRDPALVPGAGFTAVGRSSHCAPRQSRTGDGGRRAAGIVVARSLSHHRAGTGPVLGFHQPGGRIVQLGAGLGAGQEVEVSRRGSLFSHCLADDRRRGSKLSDCIRPG